jgi:hypothetical protein
MYVWYIYLWKYYGYVLVYFQTLGPNFLGVFLVYNVMSNICIVWFDRGFEKN